MIIFRQYIFSKSKENKKEKNSEKEDNAKLKLGIGGATIIGGIAGNNALVNSDKKFLKNSANFKINKEIAEKILEKHKKEGLKIHKITDEEMKKYLHGSPAAMSLNGETLYLRDIAKNDPGTIAHELGHREIILGKHGKLQKKLQTGKLNRLPLHPMSSLGHFAAGYGAGYYNEGRRKRGESENKALKWGTRLAPIATNGVLLTTEALASKHGIKMLKDAGASEHVIKDAKKNLAKAWGTYATLPIIHAGINEVGYQTGKLVRRNKKE